MGPPVARKLIDGDKPIIAVTVYLSETEYERYAKRRYLNSEGTVGSVLREVLGMQSIPVGWRLLGRGYRIVKPIEYEAVTDGS